MFTVNTLSDSKNLSTSNASWYDKIQRKYYINITAQVELILE